MPLGNGEWFTAEVQGLDQLQANMESLPYRIAKKGLRNALATGGQVIKYAMHSLAPKRSGFLAEHFGVRISAKQDLLAGTAWIGPQGKMDYPDKGGGYREKTNKKGKIRKVGRIAVASVARFLEFGTSKMQKKPFMTQAFDSNWQKALEVIKAALWQTIEDEATKKGL